MLFSKAMSSQGIHVHPDRNFVALDVNMPPENVPSVRKIAPHKLSLRPRARGEGGRLRPDQGVDRRCVLARIAMNVWCFHATRVQTHRQR